ncbi:MAG: ligand-binding sensor domain-containing protein [Cytophaga sp.]|uniref:ligand-binding sensor domain-containing protein n=1 Tax=Cytophaga sp. TaxID=29535 RepID=UPI003F7E0C1A
MKRHPLSIRLVLFFLLWLLVHATGAAQQYTFKNYSVDDGLAQSQVYTMCEDNTGSMWFGTRGGGLSRFDGIDFKNYTVQEGLVSNYIRCLLKDKAGNLWIGTDNGLSVYNGKVFATYTEAKGLGNVVINDLALDKEGNIWVATEKGIYCTQKDRIVVFNPQNNVPAGRFNCMLADSIGNIWAGSDYGLYRFSKEKNNWYTEHFTEKEGLPNPIVTALSLRGDGGIWLCTYGGGAAACYRGTFLSINKSDGLASNTVFDCVDAGSAVVWFCTASGITKYDPSKENQYIQITETEGLAKNVVMCAFKDSFGNLWFGTSGGGVSRLSSERFIHYTAIKGIFGTWVYSILQDRDGVMWFGTSEGGVTTYDGVFYKRFSERNGFTASKVKCITQDMEGNIWLGTISDGVYMYNGKTFRHFNHRNGLSSNFINYILADTSGRILLATAGGGISCLLPSKNNTYSIKNIRPRDGLAGDRIHTLAADRNGNIWAGTASNGISVIRFEKDHSYTIKNYQKKDGLSSIAIRCSTMDPNGNIIFGTADAGLIIYDGKKFYSVSKQQGLYSNNIYSCIYDVEGDLWIGTDKGIDRILFTAGHAIANQRHYGKSEGFTGIETIQNAACLDKDDHIWFGTVKSATVFNPAADRKIQVPRVHVTGMHLFFDAVEKTPNGKSVTPWFPLPENLILPYNQNHLSFEFIGIEQSNPGAVQYRWMLDGFDKDWAPSAIKREAVYSNLPPGTYTFKVKAMNECGEWNETPAQYTFTIRPPFWQTWWFILSAFVLVGLIVWFIISAALRKLKKENMREKQRLEAERSLIELEQKALRLQMNPHFLFNCLNSIKGLIAEEKPEQAKIYLSKFARLMRSMLDHSMEAFITLENEIIGLQMYAELEKLSRDDAFDFSIGIDPAIDPSFIEIPPMLVQPFVENAILHGMAGKTGKGRITVSFTQQENYLHCVIEDDGVGRIKAAEMKQDFMQHKSAAITVTQERLNILNRKLNLEAIKITVEDLTDAQQKPCGTKVTLLIPFQQ